MASELSLLIQVGAAAGGAMSVFGNLKGVMQRVSDATKKLKNQQSELGKVLKNSAGMAKPELDQLHAQYAKQEQLLKRLRASTVALGRSQAAIANNEARRASLRGKMMETAALAYVAAAPIKLAANFEDRMKDIAITSGFSKEEEASLSRTARSAAVQWNQLQEDIGKGLNEL
ncbi:MAG: hypothetical protein LBE85_01400, partial [Candidatus Accumulibacter sp.]|nr:hypothetical protein [Accumulibacter sp.]